MTGFVPVIFYLEIVLLPRLLYVALFNNLPTSAEDSVCFVQICSLGISVRLNFIDKLDKLLKIYYNFVTTLFKETLNKSHLKTV